MNLYLIEQSANWQYDTYESAVVAANTAEEAQLVHPSGNQDKWQQEVTSEYRTWTKPENVTVTLIGKAIKGTKAGVILASFNPG